jgi:ABC-type Mn2+/Zn2+ transport system ATPase subunit
LDFLARSAKVLPTALQRVELNHPVTNEWLLSLKDVAVGYGHHVVLADIQLEFQRGSFTGLLGANGSGKTTLIKTILGIVPPLGGRLEFRRTAGRLPVLGYVPQRESLDPVYLLSALEVTLMGVCGRVGPGRFIRRAEKDWAHHCLEQTEAADLGRKRFSELSGGQKQRVLLARALATRADFLLLDEPTAGIDAAAAQAIVEVLRRLHQQQGMTILMVNHDLTIVRQCVQQVIWLHQGKLLHGPADELLRHEKIEEILDLPLR